MRATTAFLLIGILVLAVACAGRSGPQQTQPTQPSTAGSEPVVDAYDAGLQDPGTSEDTSDLDSLDSDLAGFE